MRGKRGVDPAVILCSSSTLCSPTPDVYKRQGISYAYTREVIPDGVPLLKISTPYPFPEKLAEEYLRGLDEVLVLEELDPMVERELLRVAGRHHLPVKIFGKLTVHTRNACLLYTSRCV